MDLGFGEIAVIMLIVVLLFGPSKLPRLGEGLGRAMANFKKGLRGDDSEPKPAAEAEPPVAGALPEAAPATRSERVAPEGAAVPAEGS